MPIAYPARRVTPTVTEMRAALAAYGMPAFEGDDNRDIVAQVFSFVFDIVTK